MIALVASSEKLVFALDLQKRGGPSPQKSCVSDHPQPDQVSFRTDAATVAINFFCSKHKDETLPSSGDISDHFPNGGDQSSSLFLAATLHIGPSCPNGPDLGKWNPSHWVDNLEMTMNNCKQSE